MGNVGARKEEQWVSKKVENCPHPMIYGCKAKSACYEMTNWLCVNELFFCYQSINPLSNNCLCTHFI